MHAQSVGAGQKLGIIPRPLPPITDAKNWCAVAFAGKFAQPLNHCELGDRVWDHVDRMPGAHDAHSIGRNAICDSFCVIAKSLKRKTADPAEGDLSLAQSDVTLREQPVLLDCFGNFGEFGSHSLAAVRNTGVI